MSYLLGKGLEEIRRRETELLSRLFDGMRKIPGVTIYGPMDPSRCVSVVSFNLEGADPAEVALRLDREFGIMTRAGLHCSPGAHRTIGTFPQGTVRLSPGPFTTKAHIGLFLEAVKAIARRRPGQGAKKS